MENQRQYGRKEVKKKGRKEKQRGKRRNGNTETIVSKDGRKEKGAGESAKHERLR